MVVAAPVIERRVSSAKGARGLRVAVPDRGLSKEIRARVQLDTGRMAREGGASLVAFADSCIRTPGVGLTGVGEMR